MDISQYLVNHCLYFIHHLFYQMIESSYSFNQLFLEEIGVRELGDVDVNASLRFIVARSLFERVALDTGIYCDGQGSHVLLSGAHATRHHECTSDQHGTRAEPNRLQQI